jgi:CAP12/Pycsar effector protein, TIR domain
MPQNGSNPSYADYKTIVYNWKVTVAKLEEQIHNGGKIRDRGRDCFAYSMRADSVLLDYYKWEIHTRDVLSAYFRTDQYLSEFEDATPVFELELDTIDGMTAEEIEEILDDFLGKQIFSLELILQKLKIIPPPTTEREPETDREDQQRDKESRKVFIVHGHDGEAKLSVARFIEKLDLKPVILHERPDGGKTIIEKFERYSDVGFAVVLFTPDDLVRRRTR